MEWVLTGLDWLNGMGVDLIELGEIGLDWTRLDWLGLGG